MSRQAISFIFIMLPIFVWPAFMKNNYRVDLELVEPCENNKNLESPLRNFRFVRFNRTHKTLSFDVTFHRPLDDKVGIDLKLDREANARWISSPILPYQPNACEASLKLFADTTIPFLRALGVKHPDQCPTPPGNYSMRNYIISFETINFPFFGGRFRMTQTYELNPSRTVLYCIRHVYKLVENV